MDAVQIELLEELQYVDTICRDILSAEKDVVAYIEQFGWNSDVHLNNFSLIETDESSGAYFF